MDFAGVRATDDRRGKWRDHPGKGQGTLPAPPTTEKMLSANRKMSNIFLQRGQNIDIAPKKQPGSSGNFGSWRGLAVYLR
jgi:hypothetical protein